MFTCHEHIMRIFYEIGVEVRVLPPQGKPGEARVYVPEVPVAEPKKITVIEPQPAPVVIVETPKPEPIVVTQPAPPVVIETPPPPAPIQVVQVVAPAPEPPAPSIDWLWYEDDLDPNDDEFFDMDARQKLADSQAEDAIIDGWIESEVTPPSPADIEDYWRNRPISA